MQLAYLALVFFTAFFVQSSIGFGAAIIAIALGSLVAGLDDLLPTIVFASIAVSGFLAVRHAGHIDKRLLFGRVVPLMGIGIPVGLQLYDLLDGPSLKRLFGAFVVLVSVIELVRLRLHAGRTARPLDPVSGGAFLLAGGVIHGLFATGGPLVVYVISRNLADKSAFRATLSGLWVVLNTILLVTFVASGRVDSTNLVFTAQMLVPLALGLLAGEWLHARIRGEAFRVAVYVLLLATGVVLVT